MVVRGIDRTPKIGILEIQLCQNAIQIIRGFNPFPSKPLFLCVCVTRLLKTLRGKEKLLVTSNFSFSYSVFYPFRRTFCHSHQIQNSCLQVLSVWKSLKRVFWERVKKPEKEAFENTLWNGKKMQITCNFFFSHDVF